MATAPDDIDLLAWIGISGTADSDALSIAVDVVATARSRVEVRCVAVEDDDYPDPMRTAVLIEAARLFKRRVSPEGVAGFDDLGVIRILGRDPDIEDLLAPYLLLDGFSGGTIEDDA